MMSFNQSKTSNALNTFESFIHKFSTKQNWNKKSIALKWYDKKVDNKDPFSIVNSFPGKYWFIDSNGWENIAKTILSSDFYHNLREGNIKIK